MTPEQIQSQSWEIVRSYLATATRAQWHLFAARANYDSNAAAFQWLIDNPETDRATVLLLYWNLGAAWYVQFACEQDALHPPTFALLRLIEQRYDAGYYQNADIWFDPRHSDGAGPGDYPDIPVITPIPDLMLHAVNGKDYVEVDCDPEGFDEGLPLAVVDALYALHEPD
ncbi:MAG: DUF4274 domain-containing protein [Pseudomonadota bacterium]